jgi:hypothetical protein
MCLFALKNIGGLLFRPPWEHGNIYRLENHSVSVPAMLFWAIIKTLEYIEEAWEQPVVALAVAVTGTGTGTGTDRGTGRGRGTGDHTT